MIQLIDTKELSDVTVVESEFLNDWVGKGWELIAIVQEKVSDLHSQSRQCFGGTSERACSHGIYGSGCYAQEYIDTPIEVFRTKYVLARRKESVMAEMGRRVEELELDVENAIQARNNARAKQDEWKISAEDLDRQLREAVAIGDKLSDKNREQEKRIQSHLETINKMESDLGKVREHFGNAAVDKLLGPEPF